MVLNQIMMMEQDFFIYDKKIDIKKLNYVQYEI